MSQEMDIWITGECFKGEGGISLGHTVGNMQPEWVLMELGSTTRPSTIPRHRVGSQSVVPSLNVKDDEERSQSLCCGDKNQAAQERK
jgi:hypothetical protein